MTAQERRKLADTIRTLLAAVERGEIEADANRSRYWAGALAALDAVDGRSGGLLDPERP